MKFSFSTFVLVSVLVAGCTSPKYGAFEPKGDLAASDANAFADYGPAMAAHKGYQMAYEWQQANPEAVAAATLPQVLRGFLASDEAADGLLAKIGTSYDGDPIALTQIAAVTQLVMTPGCDKAKACRDRWVAALERTRRNTDDGYVRTFCDQQLRLCR